MADEETTFLRKAYQEMVFEDIQWRDTWEALAATRARFVTDSKGFYDSLVANVRDGLGADDRISGIEALCLRQSVGHKSVSRALGTQPQRWEMDSPSQVAAPNES